MKEYKYTAYAYHIDSGEENEKTIVATEKQMLELGKFVAEEGEYLLNNNGVQNFYCDIAHDIESLFTEGDEENYDAYVPTNMIEDALNLYKSQNNG